MVVVLHERIVSAELLLRQDGTFFAAE